MLKYALALRTIKDLIVDREFHRPTGEGHAAEQALDMIMETVSILDYDCDYLPGAEFGQVTNDSRKVVADSIFAAIPGSTVNGEKFVVDAQEKGAKVIISEHNLADLLLPGRVNLVVSDCYLAYAELCNALADFPARSFPAIGVTGTNGKTTTVMLLRKILQEVNKKCGIISTVEYDTGNSEPQAADRTTPEAERLFNFFSAMRSNQIDGMAMEVSSHALHQHRIGKLQFNTAIFTNLTGDHLDYHKTMEEYYLVKKMLFTRHLAANGTAIINCDDVYGMRLAQELAADNIAVLSFGCQSDQWRINNIATDRSGSKFTLQNGQRKVDFSINLAGLHNIRNTAGAVLALEAADLLTVEDSAAILQNTAISVPGRLEAFTLPNGTVAMVDYAHTHDALTNVLQSLKALNFKRIIAVFGAGGDRDRSKRPLMGKAAALLSDVIILTSDNPRSEAPEQIISEIRAGIPAEFTNVYTVVDRKQAIADAIKMAHADDVILIAGKGHENYQEINGVKHHFDDREILRNIYSLD
ncbi:MAG: UDP-N-acetylmuramoyl-L-alanyl-D-glutamate--2,6-diaminopimelate ligase [Lentisphaerae bacterium]|nr:UDP-N-acetylmuramoyl-L-alanyl-D-glutamate--2,6-diaminopimelate ligase [Lentisphaerota bacterium]